MGANLKVTSEVSFRRKQNNPLTALLKLLQAERITAVEVLAKGMASQDIKLATSCAKQIIDLEVEISEAINRDSMTRLIAEVKIGNGMGGSSVPEDNRPMINFNEIQEV